MLADEAETAARASSSKAAGECRRRAATSRRCGDLYRAYLDTRRPSRAWASTPAAAHARCRSRAARTHEDVAQLIGRPDMPMRTPIGEGVTIDAEESGPLHRRRDAERPRPAGARLLPEGRPEPQRDPREVPGAHRAHADARGREECRRAGEVRSSSSKRRSRSCIGPSRSAASAISLTTCARARSSTKLAPRISRGRRSSRRPASPLSKSSSCASSMPCRGWASCSAQMPVAAWRSYLTYHFLAGSGGRAAEGLR